MKELVQRELFESSAILQKSAEEIAESITEAVETILSALKNGKKILLCGNGGSAADAQHIAAEFVGRFQRERKALPAIALTTDTSILTSVGNDFGFDIIFSRQIEALGEKDDVLLVFSTSGESRNIVKAVEVAKPKGIKTIGFLGKDGGRLKGMVDIPIVIPSDTTSRIQEAHHVIGHSISNCVEKELFRE